METMMKEMKMEENFWRLKVPRSGTARPGVSLGDEGRAGLGQTLSVRSDFERVRTLAGNRSLLERLEDAGVQLGDGGSKRVFQFASESLQRSVRTGADEAVSSRQVEGR